MAAGRHSRRIRDPHILYPDWGYGRYDNDPVDAASTREVVASLARALNEVGLPTVVGTKPKGFADTSEPEPYDLLFIENFIGTEGEESLPDVLVPWLRERYASTGRPQRVEVWDEDFSRGFLGFELPPDPPRVFGGPE